MLLCCILTFNKPLWSSYTVIEISCPDKACISEESQLVMTLE